MRMRTYSRTLRTTSAITLAFFLWSFGPIWQAVAFAATPKGQGAGVKGQVGKAGVPPVSQQTSGERFEKALENIREKVGRADEKLALSEVEGAGRGEAATGEIEAIKKQRTEIEKLDVDLKKEFASTEKKLREANLPKEILDRHYKFVKHYEDNLAELKGNLSGIEQGAEGKGFKEAIQRAKLYLEKTKPPTKHVPLDPNKLPNRMVKAKARAPRLKKEEFEKDFPRQKNSRKLAGLQAIKAANERKTILLADNSPASDIPLSLDYQKISASHSHSITASPFDALSAISAVDESIVSQKLEMQNIMLAQSTFDLPAPADFAETIEVQFTPEIIAKAQELGNNPVKIYEYVKNNYFFEPYYGSLKGTSETFFEKAGNDFDQASLLIALLRASNIPARYVYGTVEIPIEMVKKWFGVESDAVAGKILTSNGIPISLIVEGGKISKAQLEHVWVEAWLSYDNYRGQPGSQNKTWIPLDPSFKQVRYTRGPDLKAIMNFDPNAFMNELKLNSTYSASGYYVSNVNEAFVQQKLAEYQATLSNYITTNMPNATPQDLVGKFDILYEKFGILPATLPYKVVAKGASYSEVPDTLRHKLQVNIQGANNFDFLGTGDINYQTNLPQLAGKKITISYQPATAADDSTLRNYGALSAVPVYLVNMKPVLMIDGASIATGGEVGLGNIQQINLTFSSPNIPMDIVSHTMTVGSYHAIGINLQRVPKAVLQKQTDRMQSMKTYLESILSGTPSVPPSGDSRDNLVGDMLYDVAINYFYNLDALNDLMSRVTDIIWVRQPSEAMAFVDLKVNTIFGMPLSAKPVGMSIDVRRNITTPFHMTGDKNVENVFTSQSGMYSSAMEHIIFEWMFNVKAVSAVKVLQQANTLSIPVYIVTSQNIGQILPILQVSDFVKTDIQNAVNAGLKVVIPQTEITLDNWRGTGYIIQNGAYKISGGINGGSSTDGIICYTCGCSVEGDWALLLDDIDKLLSLANILLRENANLQSLANELCVLLQGTNPTTAIRAEEILQEFRSDVAIMVFAITMSGAPLFTDVDDVFIAWVQEAIAKHYGFKGDPLRYAGYFIIHYLYEYVVLFNAGLINAFPDLTY